MVIGVWNDDNRLLAWADTEEWAELLGIPTVPVLYRGHDLSKATSAWRGAGLTAATSEGFVVRTAGAIDYTAFASHVAKWVRAGHVTTDASWRHRNDVTLNGFA